MSRLLIITISPINLLQEKDAALGNGGLGRLASCFLHSMATLNLPAWGCGLRYRYGLFKQCVGKEGQEKWLKTGLRKWKAIIIEATIFLVQCITSGSTLLYNHTVLPEALEKWSQAVMWKLLPRHMEIIEEIYKRFMAMIKSTQPDVESKISSMCILDNNPQKPVVRMANLFVVRAELFADYVSVWPTIFQNKANGITPRRWLQFCSPELSNIITKWLETDQWVTNLDLLTDLRQGNMYLFPGIGLGTLLSGSRIISYGMIQAAAECVGGSGQDQTCTAAVDPQIWIVDQQMSRDGKISKDP
ncbi:hypothetical protein RHMOL_Rhmol07G0046600 [Rhododendron molle]|uniref:Uncharacterized protein n=1 Tax=Rhododendron molle TaxID=49168 RepID=A0ACC0MWV6_RHOML|nr:hypothetical protein RHMOL_Rhmol07G0046600 [Rhododendron molle]